MGLADATVPSLSALFTTGTEAWSVRVATHATSGSRHTHHVTTELARIRDGHG